MRSFSFRAVVGAAFLLLLSGVFVFDAAADNSLRRLAAPSVAGPVGSVETLSRQASVTMHHCSTAQCIGDALDLYAIGLRDVAPQLPPALRSLPSVVATAARRVRAAKTIGEAVQAVTAAIAEVHKAITLLKADDSDALSIGTRAGTLVAGTLQIASNRLEKATGL